MPYRNIKDLKQYQKNWREDHREEKRKRGREYYQRNSKHILEKQYQRRSKRILELKKIKGNKCEFCGYNKYIDILEFAHKKREIKKFGIGPSITHSTEKLLSEIQKCYLLCPNCHKLYDLDLVNKEPICKR